MERFWRWLGVASAGTGRSSLLLLVAVTVLLGIGATQIEFATGQDSYLNSDSQIAIDNREFQDLFGGEAVILLFSATDDDADIADLFVGDNLAKLAGDQRPTSPGSRRSSRSSRRHVAHVQRRADRRRRAGPAANALLSAPARDEAGAEAATPTSRSASLARTRSRTDERADRQPGMERGADLRQRRATRSATTASRGAGRRPAPHPPLAGVDVPRTCAPRSAA